MIQIDMPIPTNCLDCPACNEYLTCAIPVNGRKWGENDVREFGQGRPEWCPMKEQEAVEPIPYHRSDGTIFKDWEGASMAELEKVIKGLECCINGTYCRNCPYKEGYDPHLFCMDRARKDAVELLKEQDEQKKQILKAVWDVLHEGVSTDTVADQDWVCEQIRNRVDKMY